MAVLAPETLLEFPLGYEGINLLLDQGDTALVLAGMDNRRLLDFKPGKADDQPLFAGARDQDGDRLVGTRHGNRQVVAVVRMYGDTDEELQDLVATVDAKIDKLRREGGELVVTVPSGEAYRLEVLAGAAEAEWGKRMVNHPRIDVTFEFTCGPYWMEAEEEVTLTTSMTSPCVIATAGPVRGSVPALGRLVVENDSAADQAFAMWGLQSRTYDADASAGLFYEAEDLTPLGDAAVQTITGASGGDLVGCGDILVADTWLGMLSTGTLTHTGEYRVWARIAGSIPDVCTGAIALEWGTGDFRSWTRNTPVSLPGPELNGIFRLVNLGMVTISAEEPQWEGRIVVKCDPAPGTSNVIRVDCLFIMPVTEGYGEAAGLARVPTATAFLASDGFTQTAGDLSGKTLDAGGTWAGAGDSTDFTINTTDDTVERTAASDTAPRVEYVSGLDTAGVVVGASLELVQTERVYAGLLARYVDASNYLAARVSQALAQPYATFDIVAVVAGTPTVIDEWEFTGFGTAVGAHAWTLRLSVDPAGAVTASAVSPDFGSVSLSGTATALLSGEALESGSVGLYDYKADANGFWANTRIFDDFYAYAIPSDPAIFDGQNLEIRHDRVVREHSTGTALTRVSRYAGDYLVVPQEGSEERDLRFIIKSSRADPAVTGASDSGLDALDARLFVTPRWLTLPGSPP